MLRRLFPTIASWDAGKRMVAFPVALLVFAIIFGAASLILHHPTAIP